MIITLVGLCLFEIITSVDNAIINADVLATMKPNYRKWFLFWGIIIGVFLVRGLLPWIIVWASNPSIGAWNALLASFRSNPAVIEAIEASAPVLLIGGGTYLLFLFLHWWFIEATFGLLKFLRFLLAFFYQILGIREIFRTFFKPWKNEYREGLVGFSIFMGIFFKVLFLLFDFFFFGILVLLEFIILATWFLIPFSVFIGIYAAFFT